MDSCDGAGMPMVMFVLLTPMLFLEMLRYLLGIFELGAPADGIAVEVGEGVEDIVDALRVAVERIHGADEYRFATLYREDGEECEDEKRGGATRDTRHEPFPFIEFGGTDEELKWTEYALSDVCFEQGFDAEDDDGRYIADAVIDLRGDLVFEATEFAVLRDDGTVESHDDAYRDDGRKENDEDGIPTEEGKCDDRADEAYPCLDNLESVFGKIEERAGSLFDFVDGVTGMVIRMPRHRECEGAIEEVLFVIRPNEKGVFRLDDARRSVEHPEGDSLYDEEREEEEKRMEIFFRDALLLNGIQNLRDDEWFE